MIDGDRLSTLGDEDTLIASEQVIELRQRSPHLGGRERQRRRLFALRVGGRCERGGGGDGDSPRKHLALALGRVVLIGGSVLVRRAFHLLEPAQLHRLGRGERRRRQRHGRGGFHNRLGSRGGDARAVGRGSLCTTRDEGVGHGV